MLVISTRVWSTISNNLSKFSSIIWNMVTNSKLLDIKHSSFHHKHVKFEGYLIPQMISTNFYLHF